MAGWKQTAGGIHALIIMGVGRVGADRMSADGEGVGPRGRVGVDPLLHYSAAIRAFARRHI